MKVKELKAILNSVEDEEMNAVVNSYYSSEINGYFYDKKDDKTVLVLTSLNVQPRV